ncbi:MAG: NADH-quinone oxidoreductase subunit NuoE [Phycisphaerae bacterium]
MLNDEEKKEIESSLHPHEPRRTVVAEALKIVQRRRGWVSDEDIKDVAAFLGMTPEEVDSIATFYNLIFRSAVGRHVILICDGVSCWVMEYNKIREHLTRRLGIALGETSADGRFTLLPTACLGACEQAPAMMIDEDLHGYLTPEKVDQILDQYE